MYKCDFSCYFHTQENRMRGGVCLLQGAVPASPPFSLFLSSLHLSLEPLLSSFPRLPFLFFSPGFLSAPPPRPCPMHSAPLRSSPALATCPSWL